MCILTQSIHDSIHDSMILHYTIFQTKLRKLIPQQPQGKNEGKKSSYKSTYFGKHFHVSLVLCYTGKKKKKVVLGVICSLSHNWQIGNMNFFCYHTTKNNIYLYWLDFLYNCRTPVQIHQWKIPQKISSSNTTMTLSFLLLTLGNNTKEIIFLECYIKLKNRVSWCDTQQITLTSPESFLQLCKVLISCRI